MTTKTMTYDEFCEWVGGDEYDLNEVSNEFIEQGRWTTSYEIVFLHDDGKYYRFVREEGSTEMQEIDTYEVDVEEVHPVEKTVVVTTWEPVE